MPQTRRTPRLLTPKQFAREVMLSPSAIYRAVERGELRAVRVGGPGSSIRIPMSELERVLRPVAREERR